MKKTSDMSPRILLTTLIAPILWGTTYITITEFLPAHRPLFVAVLRVVPAGLLLVTIGFRAASWRPRGRDWLHVGVLGLCNFGFFFPLLITAAYRLPGGVAASAGGLQPLLVACITAMLASRRPSRHDLAVGLLAAMGVSLIVVRPGAAFDAVGVIAAIGANISFAVGVVLTKRFPVPVNRISATGWQLLIGGAALIPLAIVVEGAPPTLTWQNIGGFAYLGLVGTGLAFLLWFNGIRRLPAAAPPLLGLAAPMTGAAIGWLVLDQSLSPTQLAGFGVTFAAITAGAVMAGQPNSSSTSMASVALRSEVRNCSSSV